jgi:succinate-acetate transporter protein
LEPISSGFILVLRFFVVYASVAMSCGLIQILAGMSPMRERLIFGLTAQLAPDRPQ